MGLGRDANVFRTGTRLARKANGIPTNATLGLAKLLICKGEKLGTRFRKSQGSEGIPAKREIGPLVTVLQSQGLEPKPRPNLGFSAAAGWAENGLGDTDWSSGGNRDPTFSARWSLTLWNRLD